MSPTELIYLTISAILTLTIIIFEFLRDTKNTLGGLLHGLLLLGGSVLMLAAARWLLDLRVITGQPGLDGLVRFGLVVIWIVVFGLLLVYTTTHPTSRVFVSGIITFVVVYVVVRIVHASAISLFGWLLAGS